MLKILPYIWFFILGTALGSFFNVVIDRLPEGRDIVFARSACSDCGTRLRWYDLIPVVSYLSIGGKCRYCGAKLSPWYLISEITVGGLSTLGYALFVHNGEAAFLIGTLILWYLLYIVAVMDWKTGMIMDLFSILIAVSGIIFGLIRGRGILEILLGGVAGLLVFGLLYLGARLILKREGLGLGDVFLLGAAGLWMPWTQTLITAFLTAYVALVFILIKFLKDRKVGLKSELPLGPSICIAVFLMNIFGTNIQNFIFRLILP